MPDFIKLIMIGFLIYWVVKLLRKYTKRKPEIDINDYIETTKLLNKNTIYAKNLYRLKEELKKRNFDRPGVAIFTNLKSNKIYVKRFDMNLIMGVSYTIRGLGNEDIDRDIKSGDNFMITFIPLSSSLFHDLDSLESHYISRFNNSKVEYNKTNGLENNSKTAEDNKIEKITNGKTDEDNKTEKTTHSKTDKDNNTQIHINKGGYHLTYEGKIYPCKAKIFRCPYGEEYHSETITGLYDKLIETYGLDAEHSDLAMKELEVRNRLVGLSSLSEAIEKVNSPVDVVVATLGKALAHINSQETIEIVSKWELFEREAAEDVRLAYLVGQDTMPKFIPARIRALGGSLFDEKDEGIPRRLFESDQEKNLREIMGRLESRRQKFYEYEKIYKWGLNHTNLMKVWTETRNSFEKFFHDLITSKMISQPVFYGDFENAKEMIRHMDNYELLSIFDDYSMTDREIEENVKKADYFRYKRRMDLTEKANDKMEAWYNRNREIYESWKINTPRRVLLYMEIVKEIDRRLLLRPDSVVGELLAESKWK